MKKRNSTGIAEVELVAIHMYNHVHRALLENT